MRQVETLHLEKRTLGREILSLNIGRGHRCGAHGLCGPKVESWVEALTINKKDLSNRWVSWNHTACGWLLSTTQTGSQYWLFLATRPRKPLCFIFLFKDDWEVMSSSSLQAIRQKSDKHLVGMLLIKVKSFPGISQSSGSKNMTAEWRGEAPPKVLRLWLEQDVLPLLSLSAEAFPIFKYIPLIPPPHSNTFLTLGGTDAGVMPAKNKSRRRGKKPILQ